MNLVAKLTQEQIEKLAVEIRTFLLEHDMWVDTQIYFNGKCFDTHDKETGEFYYNDPEHLVVRENEDPRRYFENVAEDISSVWLLKAVFAICSGTVQTQESRKSSTEF